MLTVFKVLWPVISAEYFDEYGFRESGKPLDFSGVLANANPTSG
jgi:hypothetical protein